MNEELAKRALESVKKQFRDYIGAGYPEPELIQDYGTVFTANGGANIHEMTTSWAIVWEEGPHQWTYMCPEGGYDEEMSSELQMKVEREAAPEWPEEVWAEPTNHYVLSLIRKES